MEYTRLDLEKSKKLQAFMVGLGNHVDNVGFTVSDLVQGKIIDIERLGNALKSLVCLLPLLGHTAPIQELAEALIRRAIETIAVIVSGGPSPRITGDDATDSIFLAVVNCLAPGLGGFAGNENACGGTQHEIVRRLCGEMEEMILGVDDPLDDREWAQIWAMKRYPTANFSRTKLIENLTKKKD